MLQTMRIRHGVLQTAVLRFRRGGQTVTVIGTSHVGEAAYYAAVHDLACRLEAAGATVQYEKVKPAAEEEWAAAGEEERAMRGWLNEGTPHDYDVLLLDALKSYLGWADQHELACEASWVNTDISSLEYVRLVGPENLRAAEEDLDRKRARIGDDAMRQIAGPFAAILFRAMCADRFGLLSRLAHRSPHRRAQEAVTLKARNERAMLALPSDGDAVMIWGTAHLVGLKSALRAAGFRTAGTAWLPVGRLPGTWESLREMRKTVRDFIREPACKAEPATNLDPTRPCQPLDATYDLTRDKTSRA